MSPSSVIDAFYIELLKKSENLFRAIRMFQCEIQRLKNQIIIEISIDVVIPPVTLFEKRTHVEKTGSVLHLYKSSTMLATMIGLLEQMKFLC